MPVRGDMKRWQRIFGRPSESGLIVLDDALEALGPDGDLGTRTDDVPLERIVGTVGRPFDFDEDFRLVNGCLRDRWERLARAVESGFEPPPVKLIQLDELYFVADGHHRVSVARELGRRVISARVHRVCTIAYAMACLRAAHLPSKAAERRFLERVPLPVEVREGLWLDEPAEWMRLADAAEVWALRRSLEDRRPADRAELAAAWWAEEVVPVVTRLRDAGIDLELRDVQLYVTALAVRDRLGRPDWPADLVDQLKDNPRLVRR